VLMQLGTSRATLLAVLLLVLPAVPGRTGKPFPQRKHQLRRTDQYEHQINKAAGSRILLAPAPPAEPANSPGPLCVAAVNFGAAGIGDISKPDFIGSFSVVLLHDGVQVRTHVGVQSCEGSVLRVFQQCW
jgi:hypothetical protein